MTTTHVPPTTDTRVARTLAIAGGALLLVGAIAALLFRRAVDQAMMTAEFTYAAGGVYDPSTAQLAVGGYWVGVALALVGAALLFAALIVRVTRR